MEKKKKMTLQEKISYRKYKKPGKAVSWVLYHLILKPILSKQFNPELKVIDNINDTKGPKFLIWNHQSRCDYIYINQLTYPTTPNYMVGYNEHFRSHLQLVSKLLQFIPKKNFETDIDSIRAIRSILNQGGTVAFSPEGMSSIYGQSQPILPGTGKMFKKFNVPVYFVKLRGAYLSNTKCCLDNRKGKVEASLELLFSVDDIKRLSSEEIDNKINEVLWNDDYEWNKEKHIKYETHGRICHHLADLCYRCPKCGHELEMEAHDDIIKCNHCGNGAHMNDYYEFEPFDENCVIPESPSKWVEEERRVTYKEIKSNPNFEFKEKCKIGKLDPYKTLKHKATSIPCGEGELTVNHEGIFFKGMKDNENWEFKLSYEQVHTLVMVTDTTFFSFYVNGDYFDFFPERPIVIKLLLIVEEMHRLHVNKWKNFPWMEHIYKD